MKAIKILLTFAALTFFVSTNSAQVVVKVKPVKPKAVVVKPAKAKPGYVWIGGSWKVNSSGKYVYVNGCWSKIKPGKIWVEGHWKKVPGGWKWIPGHWKAV